MRGYTIAAVLISSFFLATPALAVVEISDGSVKALYHLEDEVDSSGNGYNLTNTGSVSFNSGKLSNSASTSAGKYLSVVSNLTIDGGDIGICVWALTTQQPTSEYIVPIFSQFSTGNDVSYTIGYSNNAGHKEVWFIRTRDSVAEQGIYYDYTMENDVWYHLCLNYAPSVVEGFIGGSSIGTASAGGNGATATASISVLGTEYNNLGGTEWTGQIDEVVVLNRSFTGGEVTALYNADAGDEVCVDVGCGSPPPTPTSTASTTLSSSELLATYLMFVLDAFFFVACVIGVIFAIKYLFHL